MYTMFYMEKPKLYLKYIDVALDELDGKTFDLFKRMNPKLATIVLIELGKKLCEEDEFYSIIDPLKLKWYQFSRRFKAWLQEKKLRRKLSRKRTMRT